MKTNDSDPVNKLLEHESAGGFLLMGAATLAIILANSPLLAWYSMLLETPLSIQIGALKIAKPLLLWVNDGLMAVFFFLVGLELKRELIEGELSSIKRVVLPGVGAIGGMLFPALVYLAFNHKDPIAVSGWAIPAATDIAFALGVLTLLGSRVPTSLKVFLTSLAIFDDLGAIVIIAIFYTSKISLTALAVAAVAILILFIMNRRGAISKSLYISVGLVLWVALLKSGVHATLSGVILAMFIPMSNPMKEGLSPLKEMEQDLHATVSFLILPFFAFCNSGLSFAGMGIDAVLHPVPIGIAAGLFFGKQIGVFLFCWMGIRLGLAELPKGSSWMSLYGVAILCGVGFTMSLFIGSLAFEASGMNRFFDERLGILVGSLASGVIGYFVLSTSLPKKDH